MNSVFAILTLAGVVTSRSDGTTYHKYSNKDPEGKILSSEYPYSYDNTKPEHFYFHGQDDEKVQITFHNFNLYRKNSNQNCGTDGSYISYKRTEKSEAEKFCGNVKPLPIMSEDKEFHLEYVPTRVPNDIRGQLTPDGQLIEIGFNATFKFVKNYGIDTGIQSTRCEFEYSSEDNKTGVIHSPNFPGFYPVPLQCYFTLYTTSENYIFFNFTHFNLVGSEDCDAERGKKDMLHIMTNVDGSEYHVRYCGSKQEPLTVLLPNKTIFLRYDHQFTNYSDYQIAKDYEYVGFRAIFQFTNETDPNSSINKIPDITFLCICMFILLKNYIFKF